MISLIKRIFLCIDAIKVGSSTLLKVDQARHFKLIIGCVLGIAYAQVQKRSVKASGRSAVIIVQIYGLRSSCISSESPISLHCVLAIVCVAFILKIDSKDPYQINEAL